VDGFIGIMRGMIGTVLRKRWRNLGFSNIGKGWKEFFDRASVAV
jgi:hypothetical protein